VGGGLDAAECGTEEVGVEVELDERLVGMVAKREENEIEEEEEEEGGVLRAGAPATKRLRLSSLFHAGNEKDSTPVLLRLQKVSSPLLKSQMPLRYVGNSLPTLRSGKPR
jgi:hypothetical protein